MFIETDDGFDRMLEAQAEWVSERFWRESRLPSQLWLGSGRRMDAPRSRATAI